LKMQW